MSNGKGVLLVNLGSPERPDRPAVRAYLREFLSDPRVIDIPGPARWLLLNAIILPRRPAASAAAYQKIWTAEGSPLRVWTDRLVALVQAEVPVPVRGAMRYGKPAVRDTLAELQQAGVHQLFVVPLYPHYAMSSYETAVVQVQEEARRCGMQLAIQAPFFDDEDYLDALAARTREALEPAPDHLLVSFHGIPVRHLVRTDDTGHCQSRPDCCDAPHPAHARCYRAQVLATARGLVRRLGLKDGQHSVAFQSRLGRTPWLAPYTDHVLAELPRQGVKRLAVVCPAFVSDCLETLEEIGIRGRDTFQAAGGEELTLVPCLNDHPLWVETLVKWTRAYLDSSEAPAGETE